MHSRGRVDYYSTDDDADDDAPYGARGAQRRVHAYVSRAHESDDVAHAVRAWRESTGTFARGFFEPTTSAQAWHTRAVEGYEPVACESVNINHEECTRALEARARMMLDDKDTPANALVSSGTYRALARSRLAPTTIDGAAPSVASLCARLTAFRALSRTLGIDPKDCAQAIEFALDANAGLRREYEARVAALEARVEADDDDIDALNAVLNQDMAQLRVIHAQSARRIALRACVAEMTTVQTTKTPSLPPALKRQSTAPKQLGCLSCCTVDDNASVAYEDNDSAYATEAARSVSGRDESMHCVVRLVREGEVLDAFTSTSRNISMTSPTRWDIMTPNIVCAPENMGLEISFYTGTSEAEAEEAVSNERDERMDAAVGRRCALMANHDVDIGCRLLGRTFIAISDLAETTRRNSPLSVTVSIEEPGRGDAAATVFGTATVYVDKFTETFDDAEYVFNDAAIAMDNDVLKSTVRLVSAIYDVGALDLMNVVPSFVAQRGGCRAVASIAEAFTLCAHWRWDVDYLTRLRRCMTETVTAISVNRLKTTDVREYRELNALISEKLERKLMDCLPSAMDVESEAVDVVDSEAQGDIVRTLIPLFALTLENISGMSFILRLKKIVRQGARARCVECLARENPTLGAPSLANVTRMIQKSTARLALDAPILFAFPEEVEALMEATSTTTQFISTLIEGMFDAIEKLSHPPAYDGAMVALDEALSAHRRALRNMNVTISSRAISSHVIDRMLQPALDETLASVQKTLLTWMQSELDAEKSSPEPLNPAHCSMHSASCVHLFCVLRNIERSAKKHMLTGARAVLNATNLGRMCYEALKTYVETHERTCLRAIKSSRSLLFQKVRTQASDVPSEMALVPVDFYTRLSNIHHCVVVITPFMDETPLLWCASKEELEEKLAMEMQTSVGDTVDKDEEEEEMLYEDAEVPIREMSRASDFVGHSIVHVLRSARANVIASLAELIEERIASYVRSAVMDNDAGIRAVATKALFTVLNTEIKCMNDNLAPGAFRLAMSAMHKGVCDAVEQLILHRPMEEGVSGASEKWKGLDHLTEVQHSFAVDLTLQVKEFFHCDGAGTPESILKDGEARLRRLLNLWYTPTVEAVREFWQLKETLSRALLEAHGRQVRVRQLGGVSVQDILRFLRQRVTDANAASLVREQSEAIMKMNFSALFGNQIDLSDGVLGAWVCRDGSGLLGRFFVTTSLLAFSTSGMSIDHPHDGRTAIVREVRRIANIARIDAADGTSGLRVTFDDRQSFTFSEFGGLHVGLQMHVRERDSCVAVIRTNPKFLQRPSFTQDHLTMNNADVDDDDDITSTDISPALAQDLDPPTLPQGERLITSAVCKRVNGCARIAGKFTVASESCVFLPVKGAGHIVTYKSMRKAQPQLQNYGWKNADIIIPLAYEDESTMRLTALTRTQAKILFDELMRAIES